MKKRRSRIVAVMLMLCVVLLAACGGQTNTSTGSNPPPAEEADQASNAPAADETEEELIPIRLLELTPTPDAITSFHLMADHLGLFEKHGLDAEIISSGGGGPQKMQALIAGEADIITTDIIVAMSTVYEGGGVKIIMVPSARYGATIVANKQYASIEELKGAQMGVPSIGGSARFLTEILLNEYDMTTRDVRWTAVGGTAEALPALYSGRVEAATLTPSAIPLIEGEAAEDVHILIENTAAYTPPFPNFTFVAKDEFLESNPEAAQRFVDAMMEMSRMFREDPELYAETVMALIPDVYEQEDVINIGNSLSETGFWAENGGIHLESTQLVLDLFFELRETAANDLLNEPADIYNTKFVEQALAAMGQAEQSLDQPDWR